MAADFDRGIMKFKGADSRPMVAISAVLVLGFIGLLIWWGLQTAYAFS
ncbi:hypothetical protein RIF25_02765 [Thermosynechococcaceae cyanobacterium BACA0444]|uniref:RNA polymerase subunit sigma n=1 Tax=Pseudocalidococcus azoricus BACA0444 TaxID=2918990 RepID=A0AAE4JW46_9CYAN|nr:hypothetical protein [Pseudocalidococcus azoricus]MDS3859723.1 hypothetical protein [Pseudocalidococcus azoricus BACA0444]